MIDPMIPPRSRSRVGRARTWPRAERSDSTSLPGRFRPQYFFTKNRRDIGQSQSTWTDSKMETAGSRHVSLEGEAQQVRAAVGLLGDAGERLDRRTGVHRGQQLLGAAPVASQYFWTRTDATQVDPSQNSTLLV
jgi:hypothetical protein